MMTCAFCCTVLADEDFVVVEDILDGKFFALGDNINDSSDSREWGSVPVENIRGKVVFWPMVVIPALQYLLFLSWTAQLLFKIF